MTFDKWMAKVDALGIKLHIFDKPDVHFLCPGSKPRRPYTGTDGVFYQLWEDGVPVEFALGEALVEQDGL
jgi:hypothetical protein